MLRVRASAVQQSHHSGHAPRDCTEALQSDFHWASHGFIIPSVSCMSADACRSGSSLASSFSLYLHNLVCRGIE